MCARVTGRIAAHRGFHPSRNISTGWLASSILIGFKFLVGRKPLWAAFRPVVGHKTKTESQPAAGTCRAVLCTRLQAARRRLCQDAWRGTWGCGPHLLLAKLAPQRPRPKKGKRKTGEQAVLAPAACSSNRLCAAAQCAGCGVWWRGAPLATAAVGVKQKPWCTKGAQRETCQESGRGFSNHSRPPVAFRLTPQFFPGASD